MIIRRLHIPLFLLLVLVVTGRAQAHVLTTSPIQYQWTGGMNVLTTTPISFQWTSSMDVLTTTPISFQWNGGMDVLITTPIHYAYKKAQVSPIQKTPQLQAKALSLAVPVILKPAEQETFSYGAGIPLVVQAGSPEARLVWELESKASDKHGFSRAHQPINLLKGNSATVSGRLAPTRAGEYRFRVRQDVEEAPWSAWRTFKVTELPGLKARIKTPQLQARLRPLPAPVIVKPAEQESFAPGAAVPLVIQVSSPGAKFIWELEFKAPDQPGFSGAHQPINFRPGTSTTITGRLAPTKAGEYRFRARQDVNAASWSAWRTFQVTEPSGLKATLKKTPKAAPSMRPEVNRSPAAGKPSKAEDEIRPAITPAGPKLPALKRPAPVVK